METLTLSLVFEYREKGTLTKSKRFDLDPDTAVGFAGLMDCVGPSSTVDEYEAADLEFHLGDVIAHHIRFRYGFKLPRIHVVCPCCGHRSDTHEVDLQTVLNEMEFTPSPTPPVRE